MANTLVTPARVVAALLLLATPVRGDDASKLDVSGYFQLDYRRAGSDAPAAPRHELNVRRARLSFAGELSERIRYGVVVQGDGLNASSASILDASATFQLASWAHLQAGQFKYDFDIHGRESAAQLSFSDRSYATQVVAGGLNGTSTPSSTASSSRDRGVSFVGSTPTGRFQGSLGLYQGNGRTSDNNSSFAPVVRIQGAPAEGLLVSGGFFTADTLDAGGAGRSRFRAWTAGAAYERGKTLLRTEVYHALREDGLTPRARIDGYYIHAVRTFRGRWEALLRYQRLKDPGVLAQGSLRSFDLGARCYFVRQGAHGGTSLLVSAMFRDAPAGALKGVTLLNDGRGAALTRGEELDPVVIARLQVQF